ncbi:MAG: hypothetical protein ABIQ59_14775 [Nocardioidaceae bacterium]
MPRPTRLFCAVVACALLLSGCSGDSASPTPDPAPSRSSTGSAGAGGDPLLEGLDVCSLASAAQVRRASGRSGDPTNRSLTRIPAYAALVDQCGFGVSFDSSTVAVGVGLAPARRADLARQPGRPADGIGDAARVAETSGGITVAFLKGTTLVQVRADRNTDGTDRSDQVAAVATEIAAEVPSEPPETDEQTTGLCDRVDPAAVREVLGQDPGVSRSFTYPSGSATCSWATGAVDARAVTVAIYTNAYAGPFLADLRGNEPTNDVPGPDDAFTNPGVAYSIAGDGQAVSVGGTFPPEVGARKPLPVTPQLKALLADAFSLLR